jgi:hypothetical protein
VPEFNVEFKPATHEYFVDGERWPSVSEILVPLNRLDGVNVELLDRARDFGTNVHKACELFDKGVLDEAALDPALVPYLAGWKQFLFDTKAVVYFNERIVSHKKFKYCGTLDRVVNWGKHQRLIDIKTGLVPKSAGAQTAAYENALRAERGCRKMRRSCVQLLGHGQYKLHNFARDLVDWNLFVSCINIYRHLKE